MNEIFKAILAFSLLVSVTAEEKVSFNFEIRPILSDKCFFCHGPDIKNNKAKLRLDTEEGAFKALKKGRHPIVKGSPEKSEVWKRIITDDEDDIMPPPDSNLSLNPKEKALIKKWIEQGAEYKNHWAFEALQKNIRLPDSSNKTKNPIDIFVRKQLKKVKLTPAAPASKEILLRRASFVLTGLPPTAEQVQAFLNDKSPNAYEKIVDQLLKSKACAEKLAVDWMDLSRFADTYGFQVDRGRDMTAWRDWVLKALDSNMPYDQFLTWQLAGDLIPNPTQESQIATAFNRHHQQKVEGGTIEEEFRVEYVADRTHTAGTAFLGLTFECARCHDHKYDPISMKDYYSLFAFFNSIDESGLYSYFTSSTPTPALPILNDKSAANLKKLKSEISITENKLKELRQSQLPTYQKWLQSPGKPQVKGTIGSFTFDNHKEGLINKIKGANGSGRPSLIEGNLGKAFLMTGDNSVNFKLGTLNRSMPMSLSIDLKVPQKMKRAVIVHKSKAWTDAASRGYELLIEEGKLSWAFIHFWPGNAIRVRAKNEIVTGKWAKVTVTYDGSAKASGLEIYVDGKAIETEIVRDHLTREIHYGKDTNLIIGARMRDRGFTKGGVDNFMVFNRELTTLEIAELHIPGSLQKAVQQKKSESYEYYLQNINPAYMKALSELQNKRAAHNKIFDKIKEIMVMKELPKPRDTFVLLRGLYSDPDKNQQVVPNPPEEVYPFPKNLPRNRLGLAKWLTLPDHPLTARVAVNRYWQMVFGEGIVNTPDDFGSQGALPTHPQLLNWLSREFINSKWNIKHILKLMVSSETFKQSSITSDLKLKQDRYNTWLSYGPRRRLSAEMVRDSALFSSGLLNSRFGGNSENAKNSTRRGLYLYWKRNDPPADMLIFDAPRRQVCSVKRESTSTPLQALVLLNKDLYNKASKGIANNALQKFKGDKTKVMNEIFLSLTGRSPDTKELNILNSVLEEQQSHFSTKDKNLKEFFKANNPKITWKNRSELAAWSVVANLILNMDSNIILR